VSPKTAAVTGAGGFIGFHLVRYLKDRGYHVRGVDIKAPQFGDSAADEFLLADLRSSEACEAAVADVDEVYHLAADMGGIGYISAVHADLTRNNILIDTHMLDAAQRAGAARFFFSSSACVYPMYLQRSPEIAPLKEEDAYPADAEKGYGWEKLWMEQLCQYYGEDYAIATRVARFHNIYGPLGTFEGGREKAPAAVCRKIALASDGGTIEVWGDGRQTRSFTYIDDCVEGIYRIMQSDRAEPLNLGSDELITVDGLYDLVAGIADKSVEKQHDVSKPQGVRGRNCDNTKCLEVLAWRPTVPLAEGFASTYEWIRQELVSSGRLDDRVHPSA
jgi:nucleoside-diphosphate-sugar epimerase